MQSVMVHSRSFQWFSDRCSVDQVGLPNHWLCTCHNGTIYPMHASTVSCKFEESLELAEMKELLHFTQ